jgi:hypothetical protein
VWKQHCRGGDGGEKATSRSEATAWKQHHRGGHEHAQWWRRVPTMVVHVDGEGARLLEEGRQRWSGARTESGDDSWSVLKPGVLARAGCRRWAVEWGGRQRRGGAKRGSNARRSDSGGLEREVGAWWTVRERSRTGRP